MNSALEDEVHLRIKCHESWLRHSLSHLRLSQAFFLQNDIVYINNKHYQSSSPSISFSFSLNSFIQVTSFPTSFQALLHSSTFFSAPSDNYQEAIAIIYFSNIPLFFLCFIVSIILFSPTFITSNFNCFFLSHQNLFSLPFQSHSSRRLEATPSE